MFVREFVRRKHMRVQGILNGFLCPIKEFEAEPLQPVSSSLL